MLAVTQTANGGPEVLILADVPTPTPGPEQLLVRVKATALNRADILQRRGKYPPPPSESSLLGLEIAGEIVALGSQVNRFVIGQRVFGLVGGGGYAEYCLIDQGLAMPIPDTLSFEEAAAVPEAFLTANEALFTLGECQHHETILIHAGASGIGSAAIQLAHQAGATVYTTVSTAEKKTKTLALGAHAAIQYKHFDFVTEIKKLTQNTGLDIVLDFIGASYFPSNLQVLKPGGRLICVGLLGGAKTEINLNDIIMRRLQIKGLVMRHRSIEDKRAITKRFCDTWLGALTAGKIRPVIDSVMPLNDVQKAHQRMEENCHIGKIVLKIN